MTKIYLYHYFLILSCVFRTFNVDFTSELRESTRRPQIIMFNTFNNYGYAWDEQKKAWIPPDLEDRGRKQNIANYQKIKRTLRSGLAESFSQQPVDEDSSGDNESYDLSDEDAHPTTFMEAFQTKAWAAFEQFRLTLDAHGAQLPQIVESSHRYANELAHYRVSIDRRDVMLARFFSKFLPNQGTSDGGSWTWVHSE